MKAFAMAGRCWPVCLVSFMLSSAGSGAKAQEPVLEEVIVTAQKRSENLQDTPISIVNLGTEAISRLRIYSVDDLAFHVPNLSMTPFPNSPNAPRLFIRGVGSGDPQVTTDTSVGVYLDGVYLARSIGLGLELVDVDHIEVLRGPQGTLYGRNTTGGAVNLVSVKPQEDFSLSQEISVGEFSLFRSKTMLNIPLGEQLLSRLSYVSHERDGFVRNRGEGDDFGSFDKDGVRAEVRWMGESGLIADYAFDYGESDFTGYYYQLLEPNANFSGILSPSMNRIEDAMLPTPYKTGDSRSQGHTLSLTIPSDFGEFKSITAYRKLDESTYQDYSANPSISVIQNDIANAEQDQFSQEFQLVGSSRTLDYALGLYYFKEKGDVFLVDNIALINQRLPAVDVKAENEAWAAYAQATWQPQPESKWELTLGARYTVDNRKADNAAAGKVDESFDEFTPSLNIRYLLNDDASIYAKIATGYKSGGFNIRAADFTRPFAPETLVSYEAGLKSEWLDQRVRLNAAVFHADYEDMQLDIVVPGQPNPALTQTENAGEATISGIEIDLQAILIAGLKFSFSYAYLDTDVESVDGDDERFWVIQNAPENQVSTTLDWDVWRWTDTTLNVALDYTHKAEVFTSARPNPPGAPGDFIPSFEVASLRASLVGEDWIGTGQFELALWARNLFDEEYQVEGQGSFYLLHANRLGIFGDPRQVGVDIKYTY